MQLPCYEFSYKNGFAPEFDPISDDTSEISTEVPESVARDLTNKLLNCWGFKKREEMKERIRQNGINIKDNTSFIAKSKRQVINSKVQGKPNRLIAHSL